MKDDNEHYKKISMGLSIDLNNLETDLKAEKIRRESAESTLEVAARQLEKKQKENKSLEDQLRKVIQSEKNSMKSMWKVVDENKKLKKCVEFYADATDVLDVDGNYDCHEIARKVLKELNE